MTQQEYIQLHRDLCDQAWRCSAAEEAVRVYGSPGKALASAFQQYATDAADDTHCVGNAVHPNHTHTHNT